MPLAAGSSVPVWPTRRSPSARRTLATTSCEVGPTGLSTTNRPSIYGDRVFDLLDEHLLKRVDAALHRAAGRVLVATAAEFLRDGADVDLALGSHADAVFLAFH